MSNRFIKFFAAMLLSLWLPAAFAANSITIINPSFDLDRSVVGWLPGWTVNTFSNPEGGGAAAYGGPGYDSGDVLGGTSYYGSVRLICVNYCPRTKTNSVTQTVNRLLKYWDSPRSQALIDWARLVGLGGLHFFDYGFRRWREVKRPGNQEQTAHLQTALLHLLCGPRYEPLGGAPFGLREFANAIPNISSSLPTAGLTCLLHLQFHVLQKNPVKFTTPLLFSDQLA